MFLTKHNISPTIAIVVPAIAREGITKQIANQIIGLQQQQVKVCVIVLACSDISVLEEYVADLSQVPILQLNQTAAYLSPRAFAGSVKVVIPILKYLRNQHVASVIAHAPYAHFVMRLVKLVAPFYKLNFILTQYFHGLQYSEYPVNSTKRYVVNSLNKLLARRYDDVHVSVAEVVKQEIIRELIEVPNHIVIHNSIIEYSNWNGIADRAWHQVQQLLQQAETKYKILIPNRIDYNKGQLFFLNVIEKFLEANELVANDIAVFIVGEGPQRQEVELTVRQKGLEKIVNLIPPLPNAVIQKLMKQVQMVAVPSFKEGLPFVMLEAITSKCVVLASRTGGIPEILKEGETGFLFEPGNFEDCLRQLSFIYAHRNEAIIDNKAIIEVVQSKLSLNENTEKLLHLVLKAN